MWKEVWDIIWKPWRFKRSEFGNPPANPCLLSIPILFFSSCFFFQPSDPFIYLRPLNYRGYMKRNETPNYHWYGSGAHLAAHISQHAFSRRLVWWYGGTHQPRIHVDLGLGTTFCPQDFLVENLFGSSFRVNYSWVRKKMGEVCKSHLWTKRFRINYHFGVKKHIGKMHFGLVLHVFFSSLPQFRFDNKHINAIISHNFLSQKDI